MDVFGKYQREAYLSSMESDIFMIDLGRVDDVKERLRAFFKGMRITISYAEIQDIIRQVDSEIIDEDFIVRIVVQKAYFDKKLPSIRSGVTTKLAFLLRERVGKEVKWYFYALASARYNSRAILNVTKERPLAYTTYLSISEKDGASSKAIPTAIEKIRELIANKAMHATSA